MKCSWIPSNINKQSEIISLIHFEPIAVVQKVVQDTCNIIMDKLKI